MGSFKWALGGAMTLIVLELVTRNNRTGNAVGDALTGVSAMVRRFLDPTVPAIPRRIDLGGEHAVGTLGGSTTANATTGGVTQNRYPNPTMPNLGGN